MLPCPSKEGAGWHSYQLVGKEPKCFWNSSFDTMTVAAAFYIKVAE